MTTMKYAASGEQRKQLVNALSEVIGCESKYLKAPSYGYEVGSCIVNRTGDIEFPDNMAEEEIEAIVKKLTWHGFERILDGSAEEIDGAPALEESALKAEDPTEENVSDAVEATVEESEDVLDETVVNEDKISATENSDTSNEAPEDLAKELEEPALPEGSFESAEAAKEVTDEQSEEASIPEATEPKRIVIELPGSYLDEAELGRVRAIVASKATVLKKALKTDNLSIERKENKICFPWFTDHGIDGEAKAYMQLVSGIAKRAKMLTRVTATESPSDNDKFTMRLFLVSLNFKGPEYAFARKFLLRNLSGNSGWRKQDMMPIKSEPKLKHRKSQSIRQVSKEVKLMQGFPNKQTVERLRKTYPAGTRIELVSMSDPFTKLTPGEQGTVQFVDDIGTIFVNWDCGSGLGVAYGEDIIRKI